MGPGMDIADNPIAGTVLDPQRRMYLRMENMGDGGASAASAMSGPGPSPGPVPSNGGSGNGDDNGPRYTDESLPDPRIMHSEVEPNAAPLADQITPGQFGPVSANAAVSAQVPATGGSSAAHGNTPGDEDALFNRIMSQSMDDTPSQERINKLQAEWDARHNPKPMGIKGKLLRVGMLAAPTILGGIFGGEAGAGGAAGGTVDALHTMHQRGEEHDKQLLAQMESERGRQERQYERRMQLPITYTNMQMMRDYRNTQNQIKLEHERNYGVGQAAKADQTKLNWTKYGVRPDGSVIGLEDLPLSEQAKQKLAGAKVDLMGAQERLADARAKGIPEQIKIAEDRLKATRQSAQLHAAGVGMANRKFMMDYYGFDPVEGEYAPGAPVQDGQVLGFKNLPDVRPSGQTKSRGEQGDAIIQIGNELKTYIGQHKGDFGNVESILKAAVNNTPFADPNVERARSQVASYVAAQPALHGFRGNDALKEFAKIVGGIPKDADALIAAIDGIAPTARGMSDQAKTHTVSNTPGAGGKLRKANPGGNTSAPVYAKNPKTGERKVSHDGGKTWQTATGQ